MYKARCGLLFFKIGKRNHSISFVRAKHDLLKFVVSSFVFAVSYLRGWRRVMAMFGWCCHCFSSRCQNYNERDSKIILRCKQW